MTEPCVRRGPEMRPGFFRCESNRLIHPEPAVVAITTCGICPYRNLPDRATIAPPAPDPRMTTACVHRGPVLDEGICNVCGFRGRPFEIYACALHGKCMTKRWRNDRPDLAVCFNCPDFTASG